nr:hypothetical protein [Ottowia beijingensis]
MLEHDAVVRQQHGLLGGDVDGAVGVERVQVAHRHARLARHVLGPAAVDGGLVEARMEDIDEGFHGMAFQAAVEHGATVGSRRCVK